LSGLERYSPQRVGVVRRPELREPRAGRGVEPGNNRPLIQERFGVPNTYLHAAVKRPHPFFEDIMAAIAHIKMAAAAMTGTRPNMGDNRKVAMR
jgi:hypothetical protein